MSSASTPFHPGELAVQDRAGVRERMANAGLRMIRDAMPEQHRAFFPQLPFLVAGLSDSEGRPWATVLAGQPGFLASPDPRQLDIGALPAADDPIAATLRAGAEIGLLGIELPTRRRNRLNGQVAAVTATGFAVRVKQSFGNCPKYIQVRQLRFIDRPGGTAGARHRPLPDAADRALIVAADTIFIASHSAAGAMDVSHRGGRPGFVRMADDDSLVLPDFTGNNLFNTLGNLASDPRAGLLFIDFAGGDLLQLTGRAEIVWDGLELAGFAGAERLLRFRPDEVVRRAAAFPLRGTPPEPSPFLDRTGRWA